MALVADNVERLKRIVDDVMEVAPGQVAERRRDRRDGAGRGSLRRLGARHGVPLGERQPAARRAAAHAGGRVVRRGAPAPRARQPARERMAPREPASPARSRCASMPATSCALPVGAERRNAHPGRRRAVFVRAIFLDAQPRHRTGPVHLPRALRTLRRQHRVPAATLRRRAAQRLLRRHAPVPCRVRPRRACTSPEA